MHRLNTPILIAILVLMLLAALVAKLRLLRRVPRIQGGTAAVYEAVPALLTPAERSFFGVLQQALASEHQIFAKVRLADIVRPVRNLNRGGWQSAFNRISGKHVDFVLCDPANLSVLGVIELDDRTHEKFERGVRDSLVDSALANAGIPILRVSARQSYSSTQIREQVESLFRSHEKVKKNVA
jgi:hypothetical protein